MNFEVPIAFYPFTAIKSVARPQCETSWIWKSELVNLADWADELVGTVFMRCLNAKFKDDGLMQLSAVSSTRNLPCCYNQVPHPVPATLSVLFPVPALQTWWVSKTKHCLFLVVVTKSKQNFPSGLPPGSHSWTAVSLFACAGEKCVFSA